MADIFDKLSDTIPDGASNSKNASDKGAKSNTEDSIKSKSKPKSDDGSQSKSRTVTKCKESSSSSSSINLEKSIEKLTEVMTSGFQDLKQIFCDQFVPYDDDLLEEEDVMNSSHLDINDENEGQDMFDNLAGEIVSGESVGPEIRPSLASLTDKLLNMKIDDSLMKGKHEMYARPCNINFLNTPKINKPVWSNIHFSTRVKDAAMQKIEKDFLSSTIPVVKVMEKIFHAKDDMASLNAKDLIDTLKDSFMFIGSANLNMIKMRRDNIKHDLPLNMQALCSESVEHSSTYLFGNDLNNSIKGISEINKISSTFKSKGFATQKMRQDFRGRGRAMRRNFVGRTSNRRFQPYDVNRSANRSNYNKRYLNRQGPSNK